MSRSILVRLLGTVSFALPLAAFPDDAEAAARALQVLGDRQPRLGLLQEDTFRVQNLVQDPLSGETAVRIRQFHRGVRVLGAEAIVHLADGAAPTLTDALQRNLRLDPRPSLTPGEALALAQRDLLPQGRYAVPPTVELVILRPAPGLGLPLTRDTLAYRIHTALENGAPETAHTDYFIDAQTGAILKKWDALRTIGALGKGRSQYSGEVLINTTRTKKGFELRDLTRGKGGNTVVDLAHGEDGDGKIYSNATNEWGDGENYGGGLTIAPNGQTAAVDAAFGAQWTWDYYKNVHHRDGIDGKGTATSMRVHYGTDYDNAFWSDDCFCMTFGDGHRFKSLEALDVMGHEMSHGVCAATANLEYFGESGGLNEANSDIHGAMVEFYARGGQGDAIGGLGGNWTVGEDLQTDAFDRPIRWMYKPSLDDRSPDAWSEGISGLNVHYSSGPMNRCFFFLSQGASPNPESQYHSTYLPGGMEGLGNDRAARIWFRAMANYMTSLTDYAGARACAIAAAKATYGPASAEERAVWNAFHAINVGEPWPESPTQVAARITTPAADLEVASGTAVAFEGSATSSNPALGLAYSWNFGDGAGSEGSTASHTFTNRSRTDLRFVVTFQATDASGSSGKAQCYVVVKPPRRR